MKKFILGLSLAVSLAGYSQKNSEKSNLEKTSLPGISFRAIGPAITSGRIADIAVNPSNVSEQYIAVASGGVWKTQNNGTTYQPVFDSQGSYSIGCVSIAPSNPHTVWVGSGENNGQRSVAYGDGIYKSLDGGKSWKNMGLKKSEHIGMIAIHPTNENIVYVAAVGPVWSSGGDRGIYKTEDGGASWSKVLEVSENTGFNEIHIDPRDPNILYATAHQRRRHVWTYVSGGPESAIYKSTDGGKTWNELKSGIPADDKGRIALSVHPANPDVIYAMIEGHGTYRSNDRGASFSFLNKYNTSGNYYVELVPHPTNVDIVYSMDTWMHATTDGGKSWNKVPEKLKHVDNHCLWINPKNTNHMIAGCDGGLYETFDNAANWNFKPNLPVTQFYRVALDNAEPFYNVYGGTQDNFTLGGPSRTTNQHGIDNSDWYVTQTGDGFESQVDPINPNIVYSQYQYGGLTRFDKASGEKVSLKPYPAKGEKAYRWNWDAPLLISPHDHKTLYFAANKLFKSTNQGDAWTAISGDLSQQIDRHTLPVMGKIQSVDAIAYDRSTSQYGNIVAFDESTLKQGLLYVGTDDGLIQISKDDGGSWTKKSSFPGVPANTYTQQVLADLYDENSLFAVFNNHKNGDFKPYILRSEDAGKSWKSISGNLPERGSVYCLKQDHVNKNLLFAGTEFGLFFSVDGGKEWKQIKAGLPTIAIRDMDIQKRDNALVLASFGRGFFVLDDYTPLRELNNKVMDSDFHLFNIKDALLYVESAPLGYSKTGFQGASYYATPNPSVGAHFFYYLKDAPKGLKSKRQAKEKEANKNNQSIEYPSAKELRAEDNEEASYILFVISDSNGNEISRFTEAPKAGLQTVYWNGKYSSTAHVNHAGEPLTEARGANMVAPGTYNVALHISENGVLRQLGTPSAFKVNWLGNNTFVTQSPAELIAFQAEVESSRRKITALNNYYNNLNDKLAKLKANARNTPGAKMETLNSLHSLQLQMTELKIDLYGDASLSKREFETAPSLNGYIGAVSWSSYSYTGAATQGQKDKLKNANELYAELHTKVKAIAAQAAQLQKTLEAAGAPYLEDSLPE